MIKPDRRRVRGTKKTTRHGIKFDSKREADHWDRLLLLQRAGRICNLERQVSVALQGRDGPIRTPTGREMRAVVDFRFVDWDRNGETVWQDAKGYETEVSRIKRAILAAMGIVVELV